MQTNNYYDEAYYEKYCGVDYNNKDFWEKQFNSIADMIIAEFSPNTVLEFGCATGYLTKALHERGVKAYGIDISDYAINNAPNELKEYFACQSVLDDLPSTFPQKFDLIISIEMIEHLYEDDGLKAIEKMCGYSDTVVLTSSSKDVTEKTHFNVQQPEYWVKHFAKYGFYNNPYKRPLYITEDSFCFYKTVNIVRVVEDYERNIRLKDFEVITLRKELHEAHLDIKSEVEKARIHGENLLANERALYNANLSDMHHKNNNDINEDNQALLYRIEQKEQHIRNLSAMLEPLRIENANLKHHVSVLNATHTAVVNSKAWKLTWPLRRVFSLFKKKTHIDESLLRIEERTLQEKTQLNINSKISIVVPLFNTPKNFLEEMLTSIKRQTYTNWELCIADGSDSNHNYVKRICKKAARFDKRVRYVKLKENLGISENTNQALTIATGDYIGFFDHDDYLHPSALFYYVQEIEKSSPDAIYCDEITFKNTFDNVTVRHHKPEFAIDNLRAYNYICHFLVVKKSLLDKVGKLDSDLDGSQDHDFVLRLAEETEHFVRIPKVLYYWRAHEGSVAESTGAKNYAVEAGIMAVSNHLKRKNISATVDSSMVLPSIYRIKYELTHTPLVSIIVPNKDQKEVLKVCIDSIFEKTTYNNFEIIIVENNSTDNKTFEYYKELEKNPKITIAYYPADFNYSLICNFGFTFAKGEQVIMLNNDVEVITPEWIEEMLMYNQRDDVAVTGSMLYYPNDTIQHAGVILGIGGVAGHSHKYFARGHHGYMGRLAFAQNFSAVTGACMMIKSSVFKSLNGFDETFKVAFNDIDFCMRVKETGKLICWTPYSELYHHESISRGDDNKAEHLERFHGEIKEFNQKWMHELLNGDKYYNLNLTLSKEDFSCIN